MRSRFTAFILSVLSGVLVLSGGPAGCGGGGGGNDDQAGLTVFSISAFPVFTGFLNPGILVQNGPTPILKLQTAAGGACPEFCYLRQGLLEAERQLKTVDLTLCVAKAAQAADADFDVPLSGCRYFTLVTGEGETPVRLCRDGDRVTVGTCADGSPGSMDEEITLTNDRAAGSVSAVLTRRFSNGDGCEDLSKLDFSANCLPENFNDADCRASIASSFCGCYGDGRIDYVVSGGDNPGLEVGQNLSAGGLGADSFGTFDFCSIGNWSIGQAGCFKSSADGSFPAIPLAEVPVTEIEGCEALAGGGDLCPNEEFDPDRFDPAYPVCPFKAASGGTCALLFDDTGCCEVSGATLAAETATSVDPSEVSSIFDEVSGASCPEAIDCASLGFEDEWDCRAPVGEVFVTIDASSADFSECAALLSEIEGFQAEENCGEQASDDEGGFVQSQYDSLPSCANDNECGAGEFCRLADPDVPEGSCVTAPATCSPQNAGSDCDADQVCAYDPGFDDARCVPAEICPSSCPSDQPCNTDSGECQAVSCNLSGPDDCRARLGGSYACKTGPGGAVCQ